jgi:hypothetical protein
MQAKKLKPLSVLEFNTGAERLILTIKSASAIRKFKLKKTPSHFVYDHLGYNSFKKSTKGILS